MKWYVEVEALVNGSAIREAFGRFNPSFDQAQVVAGIVFVTESGDAREPIGVIEFGEMPA